MATARIEIDQDIQPLSEFRKHAADFIDRIKKQKRSIILTQHGKSAAVLVDVSEYQRMVDKIDLMEELIEQAGLSEDIELILKNNEIILRSANEPRKDWEQAFKKMAEQGDDQLLHPETADSPNNWDETEWTW